MALRIACSHASWSAAHPFPSSERPALSPAVGSRTYNSVPALGISTQSSRRRTQRAPKTIVRANLEAVAGESLVGTVTEVNKDSFWPIVYGAGDKTVVLDMYTQW